MSYAENMALVIRERITTERIKLRDTHEIVDLIHELEDVIVVTLDALKAAQGNSMDDDPDVWQQIADAVDRAEETAP